MAKISNEDRNSHFYVIGGTGVGKSKFLQYLIMQDVLEGRGVGVIDPHGDLIEDLKGLLTLGFAGNDDSLFGALANNIILIDPTDPRYTVSFNPLEKLPGIPPAEQANELVFSLKKIWADSWGVRMEDLMRNSLIALCEAELTLVDLSTFLTNRSFRESVLAKVTNPTTLEYFDRFNRMTDRSAISWIEPIMNKINAVFADDRIRTMFSLTKSTFNLRGAMDEGKVVLIKLDKGRLKDSANLLGALLVAKIQMAAFSRSDVDPSRRRPFYLYIDEFQNFASESFAGILSESRKYGLYVTLAHQTLSQISSELRNSILSCTGIHAYFRLSREDASTLAKEAFVYTGNWEQGIAELQNQPLRVCYVKNKIQGGLIQISSVPMEAPWDALEVEESKFRDYMGRLPFGMKYLVPRDQLTPSGLNRRVLVPRSDEQTRRPSEFSQPIRLAMEQRRELPTPHGSKVIPADDREVTQHRYLQSLIKRIAEDKGYKATVEEPISDGRVDVGLLRNGKRIACEISITTDSDHEVSNIQKCLKAGYDQVVMCAQDKRHLERIRSVAEVKLSEPEPGRVLYFTPDELFIFLEEVVARDSNKEERVKGYRVKVEYQPLAIDDKTRKRGEIAQVVVGALKRLRRQ
jgi:hypothetical protein